MSLTVLRIKVLYSGVSANAVEVWYVLITEGKAKFDRTESPDAVVLISIDMQVLK